MIKKGFSFGFIGVLLVLLLSFVAELFRFKGYLLLDLFTPLFCASWLCLQIFKKTPINFPKSTAAAVLFLGIGLSSLLINSHGMNTGELLPAAFYGVRFASFYFLSIIVFNFSERERELGIYALLIFGLALSLAGFVQLKIMPDFTGMELLGWDPHQNRLLSTWFDPNFVGGFLAFLLPIAIGMAWENQKTRVWLLPLAAVLLFATALTLSRSAYLALIFGLFVFSLVRSFKLLLILGTALALIILFINPVQNRVLSLFENLSSLTQENYTLPDASARLRFASWEESWQLFLAEPFIGQGYNRYKHAALELGTLKDLKIHSASGGDSSLLNVLAMTGILGFIPFFGLYFYLAKQAWDQRHTGIGLGFFAGLCGLFVHSIFVNSLFFPLFMAPFWISAGLLKNEARQKLFTKNIK